MKRQLRFVVVIVLILVSQISSEEYLFTSDDEEQTVTSPFPSDLTRDFEESQERESRNETKETALAPKFECTACPPGYGVSSACDEKNDTVCEECRTGTFNDKMTLDGTCHVCSVCPDLFFEYSPCTRLNDAICTTCFDGDEQRKLVGGFGNEDFLRKCESFRKSYATTIANEDEGKKDESLVRSPSSDNLLGTTSQSIKNEEIFVHSTTTVQAEKHSDVNNVVLVRQISAFVEESSSTASSVPLIAATTQAKPKEIIKLEQTEVLSTLTSKNITVWTEGAGADSASFQWHILVAAILSSVIFFIIGFVLSKRFANKRRQRSERDNIDDEEAKVEKIPLKTSEPDEKKDSSNSMRPNHETDSLIEKDKVSHSSQGTDCLSEQVNNYPSSPSQNGRLQLTRKKFPGALPVIEECVFPESDETLLFSTPGEKNNGKQRCANPVNQGGRRHSMFPFLTTFAKYNPAYSSKELMYIDEDSDDEVATNLGRPPSVNYKEKARRRHSFLADYLRSSPKQLPDIISPLFKHSDV